MALADDLGQFLTHKEALERAWVARASRGQWLRQRLAEKRRDLVEAGAAEVLGQGAAAAGAAFPGLVLLVEVARGAVSVAGERRQAGRAEGYAVDVRAGRAEELRDTVPPALERLASVGVPLVMVVEDVHLADELLVEVLARLLAAERSPVLVVTTAWRGVLDEPGRPAGALRERVAADRVTRWGRDAELGDLAVAEREQIVARLLPAADDASRRRLAGHYANPLALEVACQTPSVTRQVGRGGVSEDFVAELPVDIGALYRRVWDELPGDVRTMLLVAAISAPGAISKRFGQGEDRWISGLVAQAAASTFLAEELKDVDASLARTRDPYGWVRAVDEWLERFQDPVQRAVASAAVGEAEGLSGEDRREVLRALAARAMERDEDHPAVAQLVTVLALEGFLDWDDQVLGWVVRHCSALVASGHHDALTAAAEVAQAAVSGYPQPDEGAALELRALSVGALGDSGDAQKALGLGEALLADMVRVLGADALDTLRTRSNLAAWTARVTSRSVV